MRKPYFRKSSLLHSIFAAALASMAFSGFAQAQNGTWNVNAAGNWWDSANWLNEEIASGAGYTASFIADLTTNRTITLDEPDVTIGHLYFESTNSTANRTFTLSGSRTLTLASGGGSSYIDVAADTYATIDSTLTLAGSNDIVKTGAGRLTLNTSNALGSGGPGLRAFTGSFTVLAGDLVIARNTLAGVALTLGGGNDDAALRLTDGTTPRQANVGGITVAAGGTGTTTIHWNTADALTLNSSLTLDKDLTISTGASSARLILGSAVSGTGGILKTGTGALDFSSNTAKSFTGGVTVSQGTLRLYGSGNGAYSGGVILGDAGTGSNNVNLQIGNATQSTSVHFTNNGTGTATINNVNGQSSGTLSGTVTLDRDIEIRATSSTTSNTIISGAIVGIGGITTHSGANNQVILSGANNFSGGTTVSTGTLLVSAVGTLGTGDVVVLSGATLTLENSAAIASLASLTLDGTDSAVNLNYNDSTLTLASLTLNGLAVAAGTYSASELDAGYSGTWFSSSIGSNAFLTVIPEPSVSALFGLGLGVVLFRRSKKNI